MPDKFTVLSDSRQYKSVFLLAQSTAKVKGDALLVGGLLVLPFDHYSANSDQVLVYEADVCVAEAIAASGQIAAVNFTLFQKIYWDDTNKRITNVASGNTLCGRTLEAKDFSGGVALGATLRFELNPDV